MRYHDDMTEAARKLLEDALTLSTDERLELASDLIASVDGPEDVDWEGAWLRELDRRVDSAAKGQTPSDWSEPRSRILKRLTRE